MKKIIEIEEQEAFETTILKVSSGKPEVWEELNKSEFAKYVMRFVYEGEGIFYAVFCIEKDSKIDIIKFLNNLEEKFTEYETEEEI